MKAKELCPHCAAPMVKYKHTLSLILIKGLRAIANCPGPVNLKSLDLSRSEWDNFQKLRYWGFVEKVELDGRSNRGVWIITPAGRAFLDGAVAHKNVWTYRGETVEFGEVLVTVDQVTAKTKQRPEYATERQPIGA